MSSYSFASTAIHSLLQWLLHTMECMETQTPTERRSLRNRCFVYLGSSACLPASYSCGVVHIHSLDVMWRRDILMNWAIGFLFLFTVFEGKGLFYRYYFHKVLFEGKLQVLRHSQMLLYYSKCKNVFLCCTIWSVFYLQNCYLVGFSVYFQATQTK